MSESKEDSIDYKQKHIVNLHKNGLGKQAHFLFVDLLRFVLLSSYIKQGRDFSNHSKTSMTRLTDVSKRFSRRLRRGIPIDEN